MFIIKIKKIGIGIVWLIILMHMTGCRDSASIRHQEKDLGTLQTKTIEVIEEVVEEEKTYKFEDIQNAMEEEWFIDGVHWVNNEKIVVKTVIKTAMDNQNEKYEVINIYLFDVNRNKGKLLYEGIHDEYVMDGNIFVNIDESRFAIFSNAYYLEFNEDELVVDYKLKEKFDAVFGEKNYDENSININKNGEGSLLVNGKIAVFNIHNIEEYQISVDTNKEFVSRERMEELIEQGVTNTYREVPKTYYWQPIFSPDGEKMLYNERESTEQHESSVIIYDRSTEVKQSFEFMYMDAYKWGADSKNVVACTWPTHAEYPEIRVYNLEKDSYQSYVFTETNQPFAKWDIASVGILDANETTVIFSGSNGTWTEKAIFELDIATGNIRCIDENWTRSHATKISPDGHRVLLGISRGDTVGIKIINLDGEALQISKIGL